MPAIELLYRTTDLGKWGAGKGARLTASEVDDNFWTIVGKVQDLIDNPLQPLQIESIDVTDNQMTITMSDLTTVFGPFLLPVAAFRWTGSWAPAFAYKAYDFFTALDGLYLVLQDHTSGGSFDPAASNMAGPFYQLILPYPLAYDFGFFFPGKPGTGIAADRAMFQHAPAREIVLPTDLVGSVALLETAPTAALSFPILVNDEEVGSIDFEIGETEGTFTLDDPAGLVVSDRIRVIRPTDIDDTAADLTVTFKAQLGSLSDS